MGLHASKAMPQKMHISSTHTHENRKARSRHKQPKEIFTQLALEWIIKMQTPKNTDEWTCGFVQKHFTSQAEYGALVKADYMCYRREESQIHSQKTHRVYLRLHCTTLYINSTWLSKIQQNFKNAANKLKTLSKW